MVDPDPKNGSWTSLIWMGLKWVLKAVIDQVKQKQQVNEDLKETISYENKRAASRENLKQRLSEIDSMPLDPDAVSRMLSAKPSKGGRPNYPAAGDSKGEKLPK